MPQYIRLIPRLDIKGPNLVKGVNLEGLRVMGKPERFARYYYENGADELLYMDIVASLYGRNNLLDIIKKTSKEIFIPLTVGGGLRNLGDIETVLQAGADKVSLNTIAIRKPEFIKEAARKFGSSTITVSIEAKRKADGSYEAYIENGREQTGVDAFEWALHVEKLGAGEILITSIDMEGTACGFDLELTQKISRSVQIPVIACGGAGNFDHIRDVIVKGKADAVSVASMLHYAFIEQYDFEDDFSSEGNIEFFKKRQESVNIQKITPIEIKKYLARHGIKCGYMMQESIENEK
ncbi:MAG: imidazole glycerol phosphate synthase cyclase subunit [Candidatus Omnitrophota bacterium]